MKANIFHTHLFSIPSICLIPDFFDYEEVKMTVPPDVTKWKQFPNHSGYLISPRGEVWNIREERMMSVSFFGRYKAIKLNNDEGKGKRDTLSVHRLVAKLYVKNPNPKKFNQVNHLDLDRGNNYYKNLRWTDSKGNKAHAMAMNAITTIGETHPKTKFSNEDVIRIYKSKLSHQMLADIFKVDRTTIGKIKAGLIWKKITKGLKQERIPTIPYKGKWITIPSFIKLINQENGI